MLQQLIGEVIGLRSDPQIPYSDTHLDERHNLKTWRCRGEHDTLKQVVIWSREHLCPKGHEGYIQSSLLGRTLWQLLTVPRPKKGHLSDVEEHTRQERR